MNLRDQLLQASTRASAVLADVGAQQRVRDSGYSRIDPVAIAEGGGVPVMVRPLDKLLGAFLNPEGSPGILVNSQRPIGMVHLTCAHELGHYFLGHETPADEQSEYGEGASPSERAANAFAYHLLMPRWLVVHVMKQKGWSLSDLPRPEVVYQLSLRLGVSFRAMVWSLRSIKFLTLPLATQIAAHSPKALKEAVLPDRRAPAEGGDVWVLDPRDQAFIIEPRAADRFILELPNHAGAGYVWTAEEASSAGFAIKPVVVDATRHDLESGPVVVGSSATLSYELEPSAAATSTDAIQPLGLTETQPWNRGAPRDHVGLRAHYETLVEGLSRGTRQRRLQETR